MAVDSRIGIDGDDAAGLEECGLGQAFAQHGAGGVRVEAKGFVIAMPADEARELMRVKFTFHDHYFFLTAVAKEFAVEVFAIAILTRHALVADRIDARVNREGVIGDELRSESEPPSEFQGGADAVWFVTMNASDQTDGNLHGISGRRWTSDEFEEFVGVVGKF